MCATVKIMHNVYLANELLLLCKMVYPEEQIKTEKRRIWLRDDIVILLGYINGKGIMAEKRISEYKLAMTKL